MKAWRLDGAVEFKIPLSWFKEVFLEPFEYNMYCTKNSALCFILKKKSQKMILVGLEPTTLLARS